MKLFQQLLVAPAALGLLAPAAVSAAELSINGVSDYASVNNDAVVVDQVTSITQFSDVYPTDWAYQALSNLIERYGCVAGYPNGSFRGGRAMSRYEAAALLNACLDRITEVTDELKRLMKEFERELAILKGRVDGLEARVGELEATQFSTTTKLIGQTTFVLGASSFGGDAKVRGQFGVYDKDYKTTRDLSLKEIIENLESSERSTSIAYGPTYGYDFESFTYTEGRFGKRRKMADYANKYLGATTFNYDQRLTFATSFTGKDLLKARIRAGNFGYSTFGSASSGIYNPLNGGTYATASVMEVAFGEGSGIDNAKFDRLFYQFPLGSDFTVTVGGIVRQDDMLAVWPSAYPADSVLDFFTYAGAPGTYNLNKGAGAGISWANNGWSVSANYVSANGGDSSTASTTSYTQYTYYKGKDAKYFYAAERECAKESGGIATDCSKGTGTVQLAYTADNWGVAAAYNYSSQHTGNMYEGTATPLATHVGTLGNTNSFGLSAYWSPEESGWIPSISAGWGINSTEGANYGTYYTAYEVGTAKAADKGRAAASLFGYEFDSATTQSWSVGLQWKDVFLKGNSAGMAVGQAGFVTDIDLSGHRHYAAAQGYGKNAKAAEKRLARDGQYAWEWWYMFQVTDNISVTPAIFYLSRPLGAATQGESFNQFGGVVKTTFKF